MLLHLGGAVSFFSDKTVDTLFQIRGPLQPDQSIVIIGVDEESLAKLGAWPFPRRHHAMLLQQLKQAKAVGFDILFSEPTADDEIFSAAMAAAPPVILATAHNYQHQILGPANSLHGFAGVGHIEILFGRNGVVRESNIFQQTAGAKIPSFAEALFSKTGITKKENSTGKVLINHYGPEGTFLYLSYVDVFQSVIPQEFFKNRLVLIGAKALGIGDSHVTPFSSQFPTPGVEIQATILNNLLEDSLLKALLWPQWLFMVAIALVGFFLWPRLEERWNWTINISLTTTLLLSSFVLFRASFFFNPVEPLLFLFIYFAAYLLMERFLTAKKIFTEMRRLDQQLETQLQRVYTNIPSQFFNLASTPPTTSGLKRHLNHLQSGVKVLTLQHHFIENILREELLPLILWDKNSGIVIIANIPFNNFWNRYSEEDTALPNLEQFMELVAKNQQSETVTAINHATFFEDNPEIPAMDIGLAKQGLKEYFRVNMQLFEITNIAFSGVLTILTDVTEIKELERLKDKIVSVVSHELKLPLTVIRGYGEMLADSLQGDEKQYIDEICAQTGRLNRLIEDFLDVARIEHNRQEIKRLPLDLKQLMEEAVKAVSVPAEKKSIAVLSKLPFRTTPVIGDYSLLIQAVINLLDNAIKFSPEHSRVTITLLEEMNRLMIMVADQGPGIPRESREEIFETFNRGRDEVAEEGFGLGLSFVKQVIQKHHGKIWYEHREEKGACFCLTLPKVEPDTTNPQLTR